MSGKRTDRFATYGEFWPHYLREHGRPATRGLHYFGTALGVAFALFAIGSGRWLLLPLALVPGYGFAWLAHRHVEHNRPATFSYPVWSFVSDFRMVWLWMTGRLGAELRRHGVGDGPRG